MAATTNINSQNSHHFVGLIPFQKLQHKRLMTKEELMDWAATTQDKLIVMAGAGDIDACITKVQAILNPAS